MSDKLKSLINDLGKNPGLQQAFKTDRDSIFDQYQLSEDDRELLRQEDTEGIRRKLGDDESPISTNSIVHKAE
ncbi:hypothetical protein [Pleionea mediterranea]|jgi:hypothetical protein|uniref:Extradiol ring-cleavage dioxygenase LigAB LigA subunit domain-containing protein n=1 Tax=Pleionea mediterranea TaxID=523701 RepID=A0A316FXP9_9GAMM|nr:hypothetical protein [Pleionea mediterranea]PWK53368.1 hypothetical protein C8D97_103195 [Pleionea mediterranea]